MTRHTAEAAKSTRLTLSGHSLWLRSSTEARRGDRDFLTDYRYFEVVLD